MDDRSILQRGNNRSAAFCQIITGVRKESGRWEEAHERLSIAMYSGGTPVALDAPILSSRYSAGIVLRISPPNKRTASIAYGGEDKQRLDLEGERRGWREGREIRMNLGVEEVLECGVKFSDKLNSFRIGLENRHPWNNQSSELRGIKEKRNREDENVHLSWGGKSRLKSKVGTGRISGPQSKGAEHIPRASHSWWNEMKTNILWEKPRWVSRLLFRWNRPSRERLWEETCTRKGKERRRQRWKEDGNTPKTAGWKCEDEHNNFFRVSRWEEIEFGFQKSILPPHSQQSCRKCLILNNELRKKVKAHSSNLA